MKKRTNLDDVKAHFTVNLELSMANYEKLVAFIHDEEDTLEHAVQYMVECFLSSYNVLEPMSELHTAGPQTKTHSPDFAGYAHKWDPKENTYVTEYVYWDSKEGRYMMKTKDGFKPWIESGPEYTHDWNKKIHYWSKKGE